MSQERKEGMGKERKGNIRREGEGERKMFLKLPTTEDFTRLPESPEKLFKEKKNFQEALRSWYLQIHHGFFAKKKTFVTKLVHKRPEESHYFVVKFTITPFCKHYLI